jgi:hypothetical protein
MISSLLSRSGSLLLINDHPLQILPSLAKVIGLNEAIILQQIHYWLNPKHNQNFFDGRYWVYNTYEQWQEQFPFWSKRTIERTISNLEKIGVVRSCEGKSRVKNYTIDYEILNALPHDNEISNGMSRQNVTTECHDNLTRPSRQLDATITSDCRDTYIDTETTQRLPERDARARPRSSQNAPLSEDVKPKKESKKGSVLDVNWVLPNEWREWSLTCGMMNEEIDVIEVKFRNHWLSTNKNAIKKDWFRTWQNWCIGEYERKGIRLKVKSTETKATEVKTNTIPARKIIPSDDPGIQKWNDLQPKLRELMGHENYVSWIQHHLTLIRADNKAVFRASSSFTKDYIYTNFRESLAAILSEIDQELGKPTNIDFIV